MCTSLGLYLTDLVPSLASSPSTAEGTSGEAIVLQLWKGLGVLQLEVYVEGGSLMGNSDSPKGLVVALVCTPGDPESAEIRMWALNSLANLATWRCFNEVCCFSSSQIIFRTSLAAHLFCCVGFRTDPDGAGVVVGDGASIARAQRRQARIVLQKHLWGFVENPFSRPSEIEREGTRRPVVADQPFCRFRIRRCRVPPASAPTGLGPPIHQQYLRLGSRCG